PDVDRVLHGLVQVAAPAGWDDEQKPGRDEDQHQNQESAHSSPSRTLRLYEANAPRSIASRAPLVRSMTKRRLWSERRRRPRSSSWLTRWRMYARLKRVQAGQSQASSSGPGSRAKRAFLRLRRPSRVSALPVRAVRVGRTQSNMSTPASITSRIPPGSPIPMK